MNPALPQNRLLIRTPEGVVFSQVLASPMVRLLAWSIDGSIQLVVVFGFLLLLQPFLLLSPGLAQALGVLAYFGLSTGYGILLEWRWRGQTVGKRVLRLRVVDAEGLRLHFNQVVIRNLLRVVDFLPGFYFVGGVVAWFHPQGQRLGDIAANTVVLCIPSPAPLNLNALASDKFNSLHAHPHLEARLRQQVQPQEAGLVLDAIVRRDALEPTARVELFGELAEYFRGKVTFPPTALEGLTDEQYVRNVADVLYQPDRKTDTRPS